MVRTLQSRRVRAYNVTKCSRSVTLSDVCKNADEIA